MVADCGADKKKPKTKIRRRTEEVKSNVIVRGLRIAKRKTEKKTSPEHKKNIAQIIKKKKSLHYSVVARVGTGLAARHRNPAVDIHARHAGRNIEL